LSLFGGEKKRGETLKDDRGNSAIGKKKRKVEEERPPRN